MDGNRLQAHNRVIPKALETKTLLTGLVPRLLLGLRTAAFPDEYRTCKGRTVLKLGRKTRHAAVRGLSSPRSARCREFGGTRETSLPRSDLSEQSA